MAHAEVGYRLTEGPGANGVWFVYLEAEVDLAMLSVAAEGLLTLLYLPRPTGKRIRQWAPISDQSVMTRCVLGRATRRLIVPI